MPHVIDYSTGRPSHAALVAVGALGVCRYLSKRGVDHTRWGFNDAKRIRKPEYDSLLAHGIPVTLNCQVDKADWQGGHPRGVEHGRMALAQCRELGHPLSRPVIFTVQDSGIPSSALHLAVEYMHGCMDGNERGPQPLYGGTTVINACVEAGYASWGWLPEDATSWSPRPSPYVRLVQHGSKSYPQLGVPYDENTPFHSDWGQHPVPSTQPQPPPEVEDEMAFLTRTDGGSPLAVAADLSGCVYLTAADAAALAAAGYKEVDLAQATIDGIPTYPSNAALGHLGTLVSLTGQLLTAVQSITATLSDEQVAEVAAQVAAAVKPVGPEEAALVAKAVNDEAAKRLTG